MIVWVFVVVTMRVVVTVMLTLWMVIVWMMAGATHGVVRILTITWDEFQPSNIVLIRFRMLVLLVATCPPSHPQRDRDDQRGRGDLEIRFGGFCT